MRKKKERIVVEVESFGEFVSILSLRPDIVMLDNFKLNDIRRAVSYRDRLCPRVKLEASGGVTLKNILLIANTGIDCISIGSLTHSYKSLDFSLEIC